MAISFFNIRTKEQVTLERPHQIGAYINSSDLGVNSNKGQDFGWRLAPEIVVKLDEMRMNPELLDNMSKRLGVPIDELTTIHLVQQISYEEDLERRRKEMRVNREPEFKQEYEQQIDKLRAQNQPMVAYQENAPATTPIQVEDQDVGTKVAVKKSTPKKKK